jgi:hypothetical protein
MRSRHVPTLAATRGREGCRRQAWRRLLGGRRWGFGGCLIYIFQRWWIGSSAGVFIFNVLSLLCLLLAVSIYISRIRFFVYVIGPRPPVKAERVDLVPLVRRGLVYAEFSGAVWRVAEPARRWEPLRAKLVSKGYRVAQSYIPQSVRSI